MVLMPKGQSSDKSFSEDPMQRTRRKKQKRVSTVQKKDSNSLQKKQTNKEGEDEGSAIYSHVYSDRMTVALEIIGIKLQDGHVISEA